MKHLPPPTATLLAFTLALAACQPENPLPDNMLRITAEPLHGHSKAVLDGASSSWIDGDQIRFSNGTLATVSISGGNYYISQSGIVSGTSAVYPASFVTSDGDGNWTLTLPDSYQYHADGSGRQVIDMPMAARYNGEGALFFRHLTGGLYFTVTNNTGATVRLDRVTVENATHYMNGSTLALSAVTDDFLAGDRTFTGSGDDEARKRVSLLFNDGYELASGAAKQFLVPVPAYAADAPFTITVYAHNGMVSRYLFARTQSAEHTSHIAAAEVGYANISLGDNAQTHPFEGNGTYASPYQIYTKEDYLRMVDSVNGASAATYRTKYYDIAANIDMGGETVDGLRSFAGVIDGRGHTISNVCFGNSDNSKNLGMVATIYTDARDTLRNLTLDYVSFSGTGTKVGAFVGNGYVNRPYLVLTNCHLGHITFPILSSSADIGGLVGYTSRYLTGGEVVLDRCSIEQPLVLTSEQTSSCTGTLNFGGLIGNAAISTQPFKVTECEVNADISVYAPTARVNTGGVTGADGSTSTYTNATVKAGTNLTVTGRDQNTAGALIGQGSGYPCSYENCTAQSIEINVVGNHTGTSAVNRIGGMIGNDGGTNGKTFTNCIVSGSIVLTKGKSDHTSKMGMVTGSGSTLIHWNDTERGNSANVTLTVTNEGSINDHLGTVYGEQENYGNK